ncbi:uncharacterized protein LOC129953923 [Eupeodes corollae]|uniref:uncharacterized protein LOC129953923 n=1 Tax=Eupeodes corollae TaxID=290404 RepID=UPI0024937FE3|nr:uncharacterized protein LOC129953923 [Eupeodes corollae]
MVGLKMLLLYIFIIITIFIMKINGKRNYDIVLENVTCSVNPEYFEPPTCFINKNTTKQLAHFELKSKQEMSSLQFSFNVIFLRKKDEPIVLLDSTQNDLCKFLEGSQVAFNILKIARDVLLTFGSLPKNCPIPKGFHFLFKDVYIDAERFPAYAPEGNFEITINLTSGNNFVFFGKSHGYSIHKSKGVRWG